MYPFTRNTDYLQLESHRTCEDEGNNYANIREEWHSFDDITIEDIFTSINTGQPVQGEWVIDGGDESANPSVREKRIYCRKGKAIFTFTGTSISVRIYVNPLYGSADIRIDGVLPSTLANVKDAVDVLSCDASDYSETDGHKYIDVVIANNISDAEHTVTLYAENTISGFNGWFAIVGYKINSFNNTKEHDCWVMAERGDVNIEHLTITNKVTDAANNSIYDIEIVFDNYFVDIGGSPLGTLDSFDLLIGESKEISFYPNVVGTEDSGTVPKTFDITAGYEDPNGANERDIIVDIEHHDDDIITYNGAWYYMNYWNHSKGNYSYVAQANSAGSSMSLDFKGTYIDITMLRKFYGSGVSAKVDGVIKAYPACMANPDYTWDETTHIGGLSDTEHTLLLEVLPYWPEGPQGPVYQQAYFMKVRYTDTHNFTIVNETITYDFKLAQVLPFTPEHPRFSTHGDKRPTCDEVNLFAFDPEIPRDNLGVENLWIEKRAATFVICNQMGHKDILKTYDIIIARPWALTKSIVQEYQDIGIKIICYCPYGEELGIHENEWDNTSPIVPLTGDGLGPGGYASYYNKGGNRFGECSECKHDRRRLEDITECALEQAGYFTGEGRCSNACTNDSLEGYKAYILGNNCTGGHNSSGYWSRDLNKACTNSNCPNYSPINGACQSHEAPDETMYGQDFSIATPNLPDQNGVSGSFYTNSNSTDWSARIRNHYLSVIFGAGVEHIEAVTVDTFQTDTPGITVNGFKVNNIPIDRDEPVSVTHTGQSFTYVRGQDYVFDSEVGTFKMQVSSDGAPEAPWGTGLEVVYTRKGLQADGVFVNALDSVDVYRSNAYKKAMIAMVGEHHLLYKDKTWVMNRGFSILDSIIIFTDFVVFDSFVTDYNPVTETYYEITDPAIIAINQGFIDQLFALREDHTFNVLGLNYCADDDDVLKQTIAETVRAYGWISWNSTSPFDEPQENEEIFTKDLPIESNAWRLVDELNLP